VAGVVLVTVAGASLAVGTGIFVVGAATESTPNAPPGLDPGLGGLRGRGGQAPAGNPGLKYEVAAGLVGGGALLLAAGVAVLATSGRDDDSKKPAAALRVQPVLGPGFAGLRGTF
jgi:hypothetical protein